jgi:hypothetical protein
MRSSGRGSGGLAFTVGNAYRRIRDGDRLPNSGSKYLTIWRQRPDEAWEWIVDFGTSRPD